MLKYSQGVDITFLGVWDTVGALGLPFGNLPILGKADMQFLNTGIRISNKFAYHALAIDEHREAFKPTLWTVDLPKGPQPLRSHRTVQEVEQRWFVGAHANVGGGCQSDTLAQLPLKWMMQKASSDGLAFRREIELDQNSVLPPISDSYGEFLHGAYKIATRGKAYYRPIGAGPEPSSASEMRVTINETIDASVFDRWRHDLTYRPPNLVNWAFARKVDPAKLNEAVRADEPGVVV
jgi:type VI secretion system (T6SS) phospholipase Tle1-like effector